MADHAHAEKDDHDEHDHGELQFAGTTVSDDALAMIRATHEPLATCLDTTRRWSELTEEERKAAPAVQLAVEDHPGWKPGYHSDGDNCATCGEPTSALFEDTFAQGALPYAAFLAGLPVHPVQACLDGFFEKQRDISPRGVDKARRLLARDLERPSPKMTQFFRHDFIAHPPFGLEDWANSVAEAQSNKLDRATMKDMERLLRWVHARLFHA